LLDLGVLLDALDSNWRDTASAVSPDQMDRRGRPIESSSAAEKGRKSVGRFGGSKETILYCSVEPRRACLKNERMVSAGRRRQNRERTIGDVESKRQSESSQCSVHLVPSDEEDVATKKKVVSIRCKTDSQAVPRQRDDNGGKKSKSDGQPAVNTPQVPVEQCIRRATLQHERHEALTGAKGANDGNSRYGFAVCGYKEKA
jgi:hypothetical protein